MFGQGRALVAPRAHERMQIAQERDSTPYVGSSSANHRLQLGPVRVPTLWVYVSSLANSYAKSWTAEFSVQGQ